MLMRSRIQSREMYNYYIILYFLGTTGKPKGVQISHDNLLSFTNWMITDKEFATPSRPQMLAQPPYSFDLSVMYWAPTLALGGTLFALPSAITQDFKQLFCDHLFIANRYLDINAFFCGYGHVIRRLQQRENARYHAFYLMRRIDGQNGSKTT